MKKIKMLGLLAAGAFALTTASCSVEDMPGMEGVSKTSVVESTTEKNEKVEVMKASGLQKVVEEKGVLFTIYASGTDGTSSGAATVTFGAVKNLIWIEVGGDAFAYKVEGNNCKLYSKGANGYSYVSTYTGLEEYNQMYSMYSSYLTGEQEFEGSSKIGTATVAGRACTKYEYKADLLTIQYSVIYYVDNEYKFLMKAEGGASSIEGMGSATFEIKSFTFNPTVPTLND